MNNKFDLKTYNQNETFPFTLKSEINITDESVFVSYKLQGDLSSIDLGDGHPKKERVVGLWEKSCFELFIKNDLGQYIEFNFSPIFEWNCFFFNQKGDKLTEFSKMPMPALDILRSLETYHLMAQIKKEHFPDDFFHPTKMNAGITTVIKLKDKSVSYWALSHEDTRPNFHHFDSFKYSF